MSAPFCIHPDNANLIAQSLVARAKAKGDKMCRSIARLYIGRGQYRLDAMSVEDLRSMRKLMIEMSAEIDGILSSQVPALVAAE